MNRSSTRRKAHTVREVCEGMESIAPKALAQSWDNVGLLAGDPSTGVKRLLLCIDLTHAVIREAVEKKADLVVAYHPPLFKPISALSAESTGTDAMVYTCIRNGIAIYAVHTALDAAQGGANDVLAKLCGATELQPLEVVDEPGGPRYKIVVFTPPSDVDRVSQAMFRAGAGHIGDYTQCSFQTSGKGTFFGTESTKPAVGKRGRLERVDEIRLETVVPSGVLPAVVHALMAAHSYEEPAFDIYPLKPTPVGGIGRTGRLARPTSLKKLAQKLKRKTGAASVQIIGPPEQPVERVVVVVGAAGSLPFRSRLSTSHALITGEIRHHDALTIERLGCCAVALGHWASERPVLAALAERLSACLPGIEMMISTSDRDPFMPV